ncbi:MAG: hypothetical protein V2A66_07295 [Pseudomonadota bacterium]
MLSAGQQVPYQQTGSPYGQSPYGSAGYGGYPGYGYGGGIGMSQPQMLPVSAPSVGGGINMQIQGAKLDDKQTANLGYAQQGLQAFGMVSNMVNSFLNWDLSKTSMNNQMTVALKYYDTQDTIAGYQTKVAMRQLDVQQNAIYVQQQMHTDQMRHEEKLASLEGATKRQLLAIEVQGKADRAKILSVSDAFTRRGWDMGMPSIAA